MSQQELTNEVYSEEQEETSSSSEESIEPYITQADIIEELQKSQLQIWFLLCFTLSKRFANNMLMTQRPGDKFTLKHLKIIRDLGCDLETPLSQSKIEMTFIRYNLPQKHRNQMKINMKDYWSYQDQSKSEKNQIVQENEFRVQAQRLLTQLFVYIPLEIITQLIETADYQTFEKHHKIEQPRDDLFFFIVNKGCVEMLQNNTKISEFHTNESFGLQEFVNGSFQQKYVYQTLEETTLMILRKSNLNQMMLQHSLKWSKLCQFSNIKQCYICQSPRHFADQCYLVHYVIEKFFFIRIKNQLHQPQQRNYMKRWNRKQYNMNQLQQTTKQFIIQEQKYINLICPNIDYENEARVIECKYLNKKKFKKSLQQEIELMYLKQKNIFDSIDLI